MNYDQEINRIAEAIRADKSIVQPWRNKAAARLEEAQAFIRMGLTTSSQVNKELKANMATLEERVFISHEPYESEQIFKNISGCICEPGTINRNCLLHGGV